MIYAIIFHFMHMIYKIIVIISVDEGHLGKARKIKGDSENVNVYFYEILI